MSYLTIIERTKEINALLCKEDKKALSEYASKVKDGGVIVDVGTAAGGSAIIMALSSKPSVEVFTIDPLLNKDFLATRAKHGLVNKLHFLNQTSLEVANEWGDKEIDLLFIDGVHSYLGVKSDFETLGSKVKSGGIVIFHDILLYENTIGLYVKEILEQGKLIEVETIRGVWNDDRLIGMLVGRKP